MTVTIVAALGENNAIGRGNALLWRLHEDLAHFKALTLGHVLVMGRSTYESIGRPLPGRTTIVLTRDDGWSAHQVRTAASLDQALDEAALISDRVFVVGGGQVYAEALERGLVDDMVLTHVADSPEADTWFPQVDWTQWTEQSRASFAGPPPFEIVHWR